MKNQHQKTPEKDYVKNAKPACKSCINFGTALCPAFQKAVNDDGLNPQTLKAEIQSIQSDKPLDSCENS